MDKTKGRTNTSKRMTFLAQFWAQVAPFAITGAIVSLIIQATKAAFSKSAHKTLWAIIISIIAGIIVQFAGLVPTAWLTTIAGVLAAANTWYLVVLQWFESDTTTPSPQPSTATTQPTVSA